MVSDFEHFNRLAQDGNEVFYFNSWHRYKVSDLSPGFGFKGITKGFDYWSFVDKADAIIVTDLSYGPTVSYLRKKGYPVVGDGPPEILEFDRVYAKKVMDDLGVKYPQTKILNSVEDALRHLKAGDFPQVIKINTFRDDMETAIVESYNEAKDILAELSENIGPFSEDFKIIVEEFIDAPMVGIDTFFDGSDFLRPYHFGLEIDGDVLGKWEESGIFEDLMKRFKPWLEKTGHCGPISIEGMYTGKDLLVTDFTMRMPFPLSAGIYPECIKNYPELLMGLAKRKKVKPVIDKEYVAMLNLWSDRAMEEWLPVKFEKDARIRFRCPAIKDGIYYSIPRGEKLVLSLLATDSDANGALDKVIEQMDKVEVAEGEVNDTFLDDLEFTLEELSGVGVDF